MAKNEYRQVNCRSLGTECDFLVRAATEEEVLRRVNDHLCEIHRLCSFDSDLARKIGNAMRGLWCQGGERGSSPGTSWGSA
jgi:predicted small metal-binding protein